MKTISAELLAHLASGTTTLAHLVKLTRTDGTVLTVTLDHDLPLVFDGDTYTPTLGMMPTTVETSAALSVDNMDARGALLAIGVNEGEIAAGLWDMCEVHVFRVNWADLTMGAEKIKRGHFGEISLGRDSFNSEVRGMTQRLQTILADVVSPGCKADLFDARCGIVDTEGTWKFSGEAVTAAASSSEFTVSTLAQAEGFFTGGTVVWTTGANAGLSKEIRSHAAGGEFVLFEPMPYAVAPGDEGTFRAGCRKRHDLDCTDKFNNIINFRGFPSIPGQDQMYKGV